MSKVVPLSFWAEFERDETYSRQGTVSILCNGEVVYSNFIDDVPSEAKSSYEFNTRIEDAAIDLFKYLLRNE